MTVAKDSVTNFSGSNTFSTTVTPVGTPRGVIAHIHYPGGSDDVTSVTHNGDALAEVDFSPILLTSGETASVHTYFLGSGISAGAQTVEVVSGATTKYVTVITLTAAADTGVISAMGDWGTATNPQGVLPVYGQSAFASMVWASGQASVSNVTPLTDWTSENEVDHGAQVSGVYSYDTISTSDVPWGYTSGFEDVTLHGVTIGEEPLTEQRVERIGQHLSAGNESNPSVSLSEALIADTLYLIALSRDGTAGGVSSDDGFNTELGPLPSSGGSQRFYLFEKIATGSEGSTLSFTGGNDGYSIQVFKVLDADTTTPIAASAADSSESSTTTPDPPAISGLSSDDYVYVTGSNGDSDSLYSASPSGYTFGGENGRLGWFGGGAHSAVAFKETSGSTGDNPGTFTFDNTEGRISWTVAIKPAAVGGDIAATLSTAVTVAADLDAKGALTASHSLALTVVADLAAQGKLDAAISLALTVAADLKARGELQAATSLQLSVLADLDALGVLSAAASMAIVVAADLNAQGKLEAAASIAFTVAADIQAASANELAATVQAVLSITPNLNAVGTLAAAPALTLSAVADLLAQGKLEAANILALQLVADIDAVGQLAAIPAIAVSVAADLTAQGKLEASLAIATSVAAVITGAGVTIVDYENLVAREIAVNLEARYYADIELSARAFAQYLSAGGGDGWPLLDKQPVSLNAFDDGFSEGFE